MTPPAPVPPPTPPLYGTGKYALRIVHYPPGARSSHLGRLTVPNGVPLPRMGESLDFKGLSLTVFAVLWDFDRHDDTTPPEAFDAVIELRCR